MVGDNLSVNHAGTGGEHFQTMPRNLVESLAPVKSLLGGTILVMAGNSLLGVVLPTTDGGCRLPGGSDRRRDGVLLSGPGARRLSRETGHHANRTYPSLLGIRRIDRRNLPCLRFLPDAYRLDHSAGDQRFLHRGHDHCN